MAIIGVFMLYEFKPLALKALCTLAVQGWIQDFLLEDLCHVKKMGASRFTFIGMIDLNMVVNSTKK